MRISIIISILNTAVILNLVVFAKCNLYPRSINPFTNQYQLKVDCTAILDIIDNKALKLV